MNKKIIISLFATALILLSAFVVYYFFFSFYTTQEANIEKQTPDLASAVNGKIIEVNINKGDNVKKGEIIIKIDPTKYQKEFDETISKLIESQKKLKISSQDVEKINESIKEARDEFEKASKNLENANQDYSLYKNSFKDGTVTKKDLNNAIKNLETAREKYKEAQEEFEEISEEYKETLANNTNQTQQIEKIIEQVEQAKINLSNTAIVMPYDGTVEEINAKINDNIQENQIIAKIIPDNCKIIANFNSSEEIKKGKKAVIYTKKGVFKGKVTKTEENSVIITTSGEILKNPDIVKIKVKK